MKRTKKEIEKGKVYVEAATDYPSSILSSSTTFLREKKATWFCMNQIANAAMARTIKSTMMMIAMVMLRWTIVAGGRKTWGLRSEWWLFLFCLMMDGGETINGRGERERVCRMR